MSQITSLRLLAAVAFGSFVALGSQMALAQAGNDPSAGGGTTQHRQISDVPDVIGGGVVDNSAMTIHQ